jgi:lipid II:glycine glycyltransferase (peptidoglycan interpeptide bridge formation enzyme)
MRVESLDETRRDEWNALVKGEPSFSMLQSWEWGLFKEQLGWKVFRLAVEDGISIISGAQLLIKSLPLGLSLAYVPRGPLGSWCEPGTADLLFSELCHIARLHGAVFLKIEPPVAKDASTGALLEGCGFRHSHATNQPQATILLDLSQELPAILGQMRKKTRQYIHCGERESITVRQGTYEDLPAFQKLMRLTGKREGFAARSLNYYRSEWEAFADEGHGALFLAYYQEQLIAARAVYFFGSYAAEFHAGSLTIHGLHPNYLLVWKAIQWARLKGCISYDLWGIPDEVVEAGDETEPAAHSGGLWGVYQFKRGFSRNVVTYIGAYDYVFSARLYPLLNALLSAGKWWEGIAVLLDSLKFGASPNPSNLSKGDRNDIDYRRSEN